MLSKEIQRLSVFITVAMDESRMELGRVQIKGNSDLTQQKYSFFLTRLLMQSASLALIRLLRSQVIHATLENFVLKQHNYGSKTSWISVKTDHDLVQLLALRDLKLMGAHKLIKRQCGEHSRLTKRLKIERT